MYSKKWVDGEHEHTAIYKSWYDVFFEFFCMGFALMFVGLFGMVAAPFAIIMNIRRPACVASESRKIPGKEEPSNAVGEENRQANGG